MDPGNTNPLPTSNGINENAAELRHKRHFVQTQKPEGVVNDWVYKNPDSQNHPKASRTNVNTYFSNDVPGLRSGRLPIGWTFSSTQNGGIQVPRKLYKESSSSLFYRRGSGQMKDLHINKKKIPNSNDETNLRERHFLNSLEFAEIKFLQPDSLNNKSISSHNGYTEEAQVNTNGPGDPRSEGLAPNPIDSNSVTISAKPSEAKIKQKKTVRITAPEDGVLIIKKRNRSNNFRNNLNEFIPLQNPKYVGANSSQINKNSRYSKGNLSYGSVKILTPSRRHSLSSCKFHSEQTASLYCISCQLHTCNVCFFERHQHCTLQVSKDATYDLSQYLQEKLFQAKMLKAQLESWVSMFENEISMVHKQADDMIVYMTDLLKRKRETIMKDIQKIRDSAPVRKMQESCSECAELEDRLSNYLQELRWSSLDSCLVQPFLKSDIPSLHMPTSAELNSICLLRPFLQPNAFVVRTFLEMQEHPLGSVQLQSPVNPAVVDMNISARNGHGQRLSHNMENILEKCLPSLPLKICVFGTIKEGEFAQHDAVDSILLLPNKCTLLSDPSNLKIKMVSFQGQRLGELSFESSPNGLCLWKRTVAATSITLLKKIHFLNCDNVLSIRASVSTNKSYWGLAVGQLEGNPCLIAVSPNSNCVDILKCENDMSGLTVLKTISQPKLKNWGDICNVCFTSKSSIVIADCFGSRVIGLSLDGEITFEFPGPKDGLLKCPADVTTDEQYIYVSDIGNNRILRLDHNGVFQGVLLTAQDGLLRPKAIDIDELGHLVVSQFTEWPALLIFKTKL